MYLLRTSPRRILSSSAGTSVRSARYARPQLQRQVLRNGSRNYASAAESVKQKASGDLPWLITALAVTVPGVYFALRPSAEADHGGHGDHGDHGDHEDNDSEHKDENSDKAEDDSSSEEQPEKPSKSSDEDSQDDEKDSEKAEGGDQKSDDGGESKGDSESKKSRATQVEGVNFAGGTLKHESDAKGGVKKRIDSDLGKNIGEGASSGKDDDMSNKQRGYSNTDTRHSVDIAKDGSGKSKKGEGTAETAKIKGTVDGNRPQV